MDANTDLRAEIERWLDNDPDPATRAELRHLLDTDPEAAEALFDGRISFGTAGLRAAMGPGPTRMNRLVVRQTTVGLLHWLPDGATVVVGYDARHNSADYAADVAAMVAASGGRALVLPRPLPTPVLAWAVLARGADAGVMITASHNPPADNGYKLYLGDGIQLVDPADAEISAAIDAVAADWPRADPTSGLTPAASGPPRSPAPAATADTPAAAATPARAGDAATRGAVITLGEEVVDGHLAAAVAACRTSSRDVQVLYSAMHGVGGEHLQAAFAAAGFPPLRVVEAQFEPDPDFPTVAFPNPEEPGALDLAFAAAEAADEGEGGTADRTDEADTGGGPLDVILANDPDADRLAVAVRHPDGAWTRLSGDQVGVLLADHLLRTSDGPGRLVASSLVSSRLISAMAAAAGVTSVRTLTGFKWVARPIVDDPDATYLLGYEEALGYCIGDQVRDKDGISAALVMAELVAEALARGETLWDRLDRLARRHGVHLTAPVTVLFAGIDGLDQREAMYQGVRAAPPDALAGVEVVASQDLADGVDLPPATGLVWHLADRSRVIIRPSGTEPKLKAYVEVIEPVAEPVPTDGPTADGDPGDGAPAGGESDPLEAARQAAEDRLEALRRAVTVLFER